MKVEGTSPRLSSTQIRRTRSGSTTSTFSASTSSPQTQSDVMATEGVGGIAETLDLMAIQELTGSQEERKRVIQQGEDMLAQLDQLRLGLLRGSLSPATLQSLNSALANRQRSTGQKGLDDVLLAIEQRVAVELAKIEMSQAALSEEDQGWLQS